MDFSKIIEGSLPAVITLIAGLGFISPYIKKAISVLEEIGDLASVIANAFEDGEVTSEEISSMWDEIEDIKKAVKK